MEGEDFYSVEEAARILRLSPERVQEMAQEGELDGIPPDPRGQHGWRIRVRVRPDRADEVAPPAPPPMEVPEESTVEAEVDRGPDEEHEEPPEPAVEPAATAETSRGDAAATDRETTAPSGWVSTQQAARALGITPRTVRWHIEQGNLEAKPEGEGVRRTWLISIDSLHELREARQDSGELPGRRRTPHESADITAESLGSVIRELADRLVEEARRAEEARVRLELAERAQSTLEEELAGERRRREAVERTAADLRRELEALRETPGVPETAAEGSERAPDTSAEYPVRARRRLLLRRVFERMRRGFGER
jgi:hypothetical protein